MAETTATEGVKPAEGAESKPNSTPDPKPAAESKETPVDAKPGTETPKAEEKPKPVVPEKYDLKLPENAFLDAGLVEKIAATARERGFSNEQAQAFLNDQNKSIGEMYDKQAKTWLDQVTNDKEIGGEALTKNVELSKRVIERFGTDTLKKELSKTGYGNHPELVRLLTRIGKSMSEDQLVLPGSQAGGAKRSIEDIFYGDSNKEK